MQKNIIDFGRRECYHIDYNHGVHLGFPLVILKKQKNERRGVVDLSSAKSFAAKSAWEKRQTLAGRCRIALRDIVRSWQLYVLLLPAVAAVAIFHYVPFYGIQIAFRQFRGSKGIAGSDWVGLDNFIRFLTFPDFWKIVKNTLSISLYSLCTFPVAVILALMMNEIRQTWFKKTVQMITYAPHFISTVVIVAMLTLFFRRDNGLINNVIESTGGTRIDFLASADMFNDIYVWSGVWQNMGWSSIIYMAALAGVPQEMVEAAHIDGANRFQIVWYINIPTILPTIMTMLILSTGNVLSVGFEKVFLMQNSLNLDASRIISTYVYEMGIEKAEFSYSAAIGLFNNVVNIIIISIVNWVSKKVTQVGLF